MIEDIVFISKQSCFKVNPAREGKWRRESQITVKRKLDTKVALNRRSAIGKQFGWPLELFSRDISPPLIQPIPEPEVAQPTKESRLMNMSQNDPLKRFKQWRDTAPKRPRQPEEDSNKVIMTEATTVVGDGESNDMIEEELYERIDADDCMPEPEDAKPDPRQVNFPSNEPIIRFKQWRDVPPKPTKVSRMPKEPTTKAMATEVTSMVGDNDSVRRMDEELPELSEEEFPVLPEGDFLDSEFDLEKVKKEWEARSQLAQLRQRSDSDLLAQLFDSHPLQGERGIADLFGQLFPRLTDVGHGQPDHVFWHTEVVCPWIMDHWESDEFKPAKLFIPAERSNASFMAVIRLLQEVDELGALRKRAVSAYYCCFTVFYGQKPKQSAHIEHTCFRHDCDKRIVTKPNYDHTEDFCYDNSVNTVKRLLGYVNEGDVVDVVGAYTHAWKRLAGKNKWWFTDKATGTQWIAVPWFWKHTKLTESRYFSRFDRCFVEEHYSIYNERPVPEFKAEPEAVFDIQAWLLAKKAACLHTPERSFQEVGDIIWQVLFKETTDSARKAYDDATKELENVEYCFGDDLPSQLVSICQSYPQRAALVTRATEIIFERAPRPSRDFELAFGEKSIKQLKKDVKNIARRIENISEEEREKVREYERAKKAAQRLKKKEKADREGLQKDK